MAALVVIFFASLGIGLSGAVMPGPLLTLTLKESLNQGKGAALWLSGGHSLCELLLVTALAGGLTRFIAADSVAGPIGIGGGLILLWMGISAFRHAGDGMNPTEASPSNSPVHGLLVGGAAVTVSNPYWFIWWLTLGVALVLSASAEAGLAGIVAFYVGHISADFLWFGIVGFLVGWSGKMLNETIYRRVIQACAVFLVVFGVLFAIYGGRTIFSHLAN